ncbi:MAG: hypothetical protein ABW159_11435 [Candidatus Thiodiazotropha sp.]
MTRIADPISLPLIKSSPALDSGEGESIVCHLLEPAFRIAYRRTLHIDARGWESQAKTFYAHAVARTPKALWLHVQRINLLAGMADPDIHAALVDLFLVLDGKGAALCKRLLALAYPLLQREAYRQLSDHLLANRSHDNLSSIGSVLSSGRTGHEQLILFEESADDARTDPLQIASEQLAFGQTDLARKTLESAVLAAPERLELHHALIEIYRHSRIKTQIAHFLQLLETVSNPAQIAWQELLHEIDKDHDKSG